MILFLSSIAYRLKFQKALHNLAEINDWVPTFYALYADSLFQPRQGELTIPIQQNMMCAVDQRKLCIVFHLLFFQWEFYWSYPVLSSQFHIGCVGGPFLNSLDCEELYPDTMKKKGQDPESLGLELELTSDGLPLEKGCNPWNSVWVGRRTGMDAE